MQHVTTWGLFVFLAFLGQALAYSHTSSGSGGDVCGPRVCLAGKADCEDNECVCKAPRYMFGNGFLNCYKKNEYRTEVTNDPRILTYNNNSIDLPFACRYLLTHAVSEYKDRNKNVVGSCELMVHAFHHKAKGKFYVAGYDAAFRIECNNGSRYEMTFRKYGTSENGQYDFQIKGTDGQFVPDGPFNEDIIDFYDSKTGLNIKCTVDENNNLAEINAKKCGQRIVFRPYDTSLRRDQKLVPGMAASFNCAYRPVFESNDRVLALIPLGVHNGFDIDSIEITGLGRMGTMLYRAFMSGVEQNAPQPNTECAATKTALEACQNIGEVVNAFQNCQWILLSPKFINCYDKTESGSPIQGLFNTCVNVYCGPHRRPCQDVKDAISSKCALQRMSYQGMDDFYRNC